eukprot:4802092-Pyramimonas_sp.AAC.1
MGAGSLFYIRRAPARRQPPVASFEDGGGSGQTHCSPASRPAPASPVSIPAGGPAGAVAFRALMPRAHARWERPRGGQRQRSHPGED